MPTVLEDVVETVAVVGDNVRRLQVFPVDWGFKSPPRDPLSDGYSTKDLPVTPTFTRRHEPFVFFNDPTAPALIGLYDRPPEGPHVQKKFGATVTSYVSAYGAGDSDVTTLRVPADVVSSGDATPEFTAHGITITVITVDLTDGAATAGAAAVVALGDLISSLLGTALFTSYSTAFASDSPALSTSVTPFALALPTVVQGLSVYGDEQAPYETLFDTVSAVTSFDGSGAVFVADTALYAETGVYSVFAALAEYLVVTPATKSYMALVVVEPGVAADVVKDVPGAVLTDQLVAASPDVPYRAGPVYEDGAIYSAFTEYEVVAYPTVAGAVVVDDSEAASMTVRVFDDLLAGQSVVAGTLRAVEAASYALGAGATLLSGVASYTVSDNGVVDTLPSALSVGRQDVYTAVTSTALVFDFATTLLEDSVVAATVVSSAYYSLLTDYVVMSDERVMTVVPLVVAPAVVSGTAVQNIIGDLVSSASIVDVRQFEVAI